MHPVLFDFGGLTIYSYGVLLAAAYLLGLQFALIRARRRGLDGQRVMDLGIWIIVSALVGAKLLLLVVDFKQFTTNPRDLLGLARSGGVFYGGLIAAVTVALIYSASSPAAAVDDDGCVRARHCAGPRRRPAWDVCWPAAVSARPTSVPWAITFTDPAAAANVGTPLGVPLHPTQLYEAGAELLILVFLLLWERRGRGFPGRTFWSYLLLYGVSRFVIEFYRGDSRGMVFERAVDVSIRVRHPGPAVDRHALPSEPARRSDTACCGAAGGSVTRRDSARGRRSVRNTTANGSTRSSRPLFLTDSRSQLQRLIKDGHVIGPQGAAREHAGQDRPAVHRRCCRRPHRPRRSRKTCR